MSLPSLIPLARRCSPLAAVALSCALLPAPAPAAVAGATKAITVTSNTSDVLLAGFADGAAVSVVRDGVTIATAKNTNVPATSPPEGGVNSAHALAGGATGCWTGFTPQLLPGDTIKVGTDSTVVRGVSAGPLSVEGGEIVVHGTAFSVPGAAVTLAEVDAQLHPLAGRFSSGSAGGQFLSALGGDLGGLLQPDARASLNWTARWPLPDSAADRAMAIAADVIGAWTGPAVHPATAGGEETDFAVGAEPGPVAGCEAAAYAPNAPTRANRDLNAAGTGSDVVLTGAAQPGVTAVTAKLTDAAGKTVSRAATVTGQTWSATFPAADVAGLAEGAITAAGAYTMRTPAPGGTFHGATLALAKDTVVPGAPTVSVPAGTYARAQSVSLAGEGGATVRYTTDGSDPTATSSAATGPISVGATRTIKAIAVDAAGNQSPVAAFAYVIAPAASAALTAKQRGLRLDELTVSRRLRLGTARRRGISVAILAPQGASVVRVRLVRRGRILTQVVRRVGRHRLITVLLPRTPKGRRTLRRGAYRVQVTPGASTRDYGLTSSRTVRLR